MSILGVEGATNFTDTMVGDPDNDYGTGIGKMILVTDQVIGTGATTKVVTVGPAGSLAATDLIFASISQAGANPAHIIAVTYTSDSTCTVKINTAPGTGGAYVNVLVIGPSTKTTDSSDLSAYSNIKVGTKDGDASMIKQISFAKGDIVNATTSDVVALAGITTAAYAFATSNEIATTVTAHVQELAVAAGQVTVNSDADPSTSGMAVSVLAIEPETDRATGLTGILANTTYGTALTEIMIGTGTVGGATLAVSMPGLTTDHRCFVGYNTSVTARTIQKVVSAANTATVTFSGSAGGTVWVLAVKDLT